MRNGLALAAHAFLSVALALASSARAQAEGRPGAAAATSEARRSVEREAAARERADDDRAVEANGPIEDVVETIGTVVGSEALSRRRSQQPGHRIVWRDDWPRYSFDEAMLSLGIGALLLAAELLPTSTTAANWRGGILFDQPVRDALRLRSYEQRESARLSAEVLRWIVVGFPVLVDAFAVTALGDGNWDAALQMGLIALEAHLLALVLWKVTVLLARRERPVASACAEGLDSPHCREPFETTSFFSNQATNAFTGAFLTCVQHTHLPLFGSEVADLSTCVGSVAVASVVGLLRVMSDFEYLTDVLMGAVVGFFAGYLVPWILHYQGGARPELRAPVALIPVPMGGPHDAYGLAVAGRF
jgi:membrane-associated phospholipid phosphatase